MLRDTSAASTSNRSTSAARAAGVNKTTPTRNKARTTWQRWVAAFIAAASSAISAKTRPQRPTRQSLGRRGCCPTEAHWENRPADVCAVVLPTADQVSYFRLSFGALWPSRRRGCGVVLTGLRNSPVARLLEIGETNGDAMNRLLIVAILVISAAPVYAQAQQPDAAKLKADAQKVVSIISGDKAKAQAYCQIANVGEQMNRAAQAKDKKKIEELAQKLPELEKSLGPEYRGLVESLGKANLTPKDGQDIVSMFDKLDDSCPH